jgi:hypothetical protein
VCVMRAHVCFFWGGGGGAGGLRRPPAPPPTPRVPPGGRAPRGSSRFGGGGIGAEFPACVHPPPPKKTHMRTHYTHNHSHGRFGGPPARLHRGLMPLGSTVARPPSRCPSRALVPAPCLALSHPGLFLFPAPRFSAHGPCSCSKPTTAPHSFIPTFIRNAEPAAPPSAAQRQGAWAWRRGSNV